MEYMIYDKFGSWGMLGLPGEIDPDEFESAEALGEAVLEYAVFAAENDGGELDHGDLVWVDVSVDGKIVYTAKKEVAPP